MKVEKTFEIRQPRERVWDWLIRAALWPTWYENAHGVVIRRTSAGRTPAWSSSRPSRNSYHGAHRLDRRRNLT